MNISQLKNTTGWIISGLIAAVLLINAGLKLSLNPGMVKLLSSWGLGDQVIALGVGELISCVLFLIPRTLPVGALLLSSILGGAIATHLQHADAFGIPATALLLVWVAAYMRNPEIFRRIIPMSE